MSVIDKLRRMLDERGIHWWAGDDERKTLWESNGLTWEYFNSENGDAWLGFLGACEQDITPEQAIAATLGRPKAKSHPYGYERDTGAYDCTRCECGCINDISAMYCNDCGGKIEIDESAEKEYYDGYSKHTVFAKKHDDGSLEWCERRYVPATLGGGKLTAEQVREAIFDGSSYASYDGVKYYADGIHMQEIADELNATLGVPCESCPQMDNPDSFIRHLMERETARYCPHCGAKMSKLHGYGIGGKRFSWCPNCGAEVVSE